VFGGNATDSRHCQVKTNDRRVAFFEALEAISRVVCFPDDRAADRLELGAQNFSN
jgi:hypothetical protein